MRLAGRGWAVFTKAHAAVRVPVGCLRAGVAGVAGPCCEGVACRAAPQDVSSWWRLH